jgi:putative ABC transport system substrate-binding protein
MRRRNFIAAFAGPVGARPLAARAQQQAVPVIGWLSSGSVQLVPDEVIE